MEWFGTGSSILFVGSVPEDIEWATLIVHLRFNVTEPTPNWGLPLMLCAVSAGVGGQMPDGTSFSYSPGCEGDDPAILMPGLREYDVTFTVPETRGNSTMPAGSEIELVVNGWLFSNPLAPTVFVETVGTGFTLAPRM